MLVLMTFVDVELVMEVRDDVGGGLQVLELGADVE